jgi:membrane-bound lytic murein transglycosylase B
MAPLRFSRRAMLAAPLLAAPMGVGTAAASEGDFNAFLAGMRRDAVAHGIRAATVDFALRRAQYLPHVIELDRRQPEKTMTFTTFLQKIVTPEREQHARAALAANRALLDRVSRRFYVEPRFIVALWGIESNFGTITGNYPVISSVATLAYDGRRAHYFRSELVAALRILDAGDIAVDRMDGSWAGAMGQCQFMPSTFLSYAVDFDGDGRRDIWTDRADALASIANFIARLGWRDGEGWGRPVLIPANFDRNMSGLDFRRPTREWARYGVRDIDAGPLRGRDLEASLVLPDGANGPALLVYDNFRTIMRWNRSTYFAAAVGYLADSMRRG